MRFAQLRMRAAAAATLGVSGLLGMFCAAAQPQPGSPPPPLVLAVLAEKLEAAADGAAVLVPATAASPGDTLLYTVSFTNATDGPLDRVRITQAIPPGVAYTAGTAVAPGALVLFSVDGGVTFGLPAELAVTDEGGARRAATAADYTHVRWLLTAPLEARATGYARFRAEIR